MRECDIGVFVESDVGRGDGPRIAGTDSDGILVEVADIGIPDDVGSIALKASAGDESVDDESRDRVVGGTDGLIEDRRDLVAGEVFDTENVDRRRGRTRVDLVSEGEYGCDDGQTEQGQGQIGLGLHGISFYRTNYFYRDLHGSD